MAWRVPDDASLEVVRLSKAENALMRSLRDSGRSISRSRPMATSSFETQTFVPFDRWAQLRDSEGKSLAQLLDEFARLRSENLAELSALNLLQEDLALPGCHPSLGAVTLSQLLASWAVHDLTHLHQISRVMAHQYREAVGPWGAYLGVLRCSGHSTP